MIPAGDFPPARRARSRRARLRGRRQAAAATRGAPLGAAEDGWWPPAPPPATVVDPVPDAGPFVAGAPWAPPAEPEPANGPSEGNRAAPAVVAGADGPWGRPAAHDRPAPAHALDPDEAWSRPPAAAPPAAGAPRSPTPADGRAAATDTAWGRLTREASRPAAPADDPTDPAPAPRPHPAAPARAHPVAPVPAGAPAAPPPTPATSPHDAPPLTAPRTPPPPPPPYSPPAPPPPPPPPAPAHPATHAPPRPDAAPPAPERPPWFTEPAAPAPAPSARPPARPTSPVPPPPLGGPPPPPSPLPSPPFVSSERDLAPERAAGTLTLAPDDAPPARADDTPPGAPAARSSTRNAVEWVVIIGAALIAALVIKTYLLQAFYIPSPSMVPTLHIQDRVLVNKLSYRLHEVHRGDVVVFERPPNDAGTIRDLIKRVIGLPGDTVEGRDGAVYINGQQLNEPYLPKGTVTSQFAPKTIPEGYVWVMGDNRTNSSDSRVFGAVDEDRIVGRAFVRVWPLSAVGLL